MSTSKQNQNTGEPWGVEHDKTKCALCVVCARNCPTNALRREEENGNLSLYFNSELCDGCGGNALCEENCPESAIVSKKAAANQEKGYVLLNSSPMVKCSYCEEYFAPVRRLDVVSEKAQHKQEIERVYCPLCRRQNLVVDYIEDNLVPGSKAEYRSARHMLKKAQKRQEQERNSGEL